MIKMSAMLIIVWILSALFGWLYCRSIGKHHFDESNIAPPNLAYAMNYGPKFMLESVRCIRFWNSIDRDG